MASNRRDFIRRAGALGASAALGNTGLAALTLGMASEAHAQAASDYKALVCVFLGGGVDGNNLIVPNDTAGYAKYAAVRPASSGIALAQSELLSIQPTGSAVYGLHPELAEVHPLFAQRKLAILANVGPLTAPTTKTNYLSVRPDNLFSHSDQINQWQSSVSQGPSRTGWGGRIADEMTAQNGAFPVSTSVAGLSLFISGNTSSPLSLPATGGLSLQGFDNSAVSNARYAALSAILAADGGHGYVKAAAGITSSAIGLSTLVNPILTSSSSSVAALFNGLNSSIAQQLLVVARLIEARAQTGARRQVFYVSLGGFDTHANELNTLTNLLGQLSPALRAFYDATVQMGISDRVTTFTLSDFGRTFQPSSGQGTDHAWGNNHLIMGGAVKGGELYGRYPVLERGGPDDADNQGRWIPTSSVDQYGATLARWFGVSESGITTAFPNLARFPVSDLGFL